MMCKVIDPRWEEFAVDEQVNKSHFGKNSEKVIVVKQIDKEKVLNLN